MRKEAAMTFGTGNRRVQGKSIPESDDAGSRPSAVSSRVTVLYPSNV